MTDRDCSPLSAVLRAFRPAMPSADTPAMTPTHHRCRLQEEADKSRRLTGKQFFLQQAPRADGQDEVLMSLPTSVLACCSLPELPAARCAASADGLAD